MVRSLYSGVSGLRNHQTRMDVIGNNISNVNTYGFKSSRVSFQDIFSQTLSAGGAPTNALGGTNPRQVGLGMTVASIDVLHNTQTGVQVTGEPLDMAISGDGFFAVTDGSQIYYTRNGNFTLDAEGNLVTRGGMYVMGLMFTEVTIGGEVQPETSIGVDEVFDPDTEITELQKIQFPQEYTHFQVADNGRITALDEDGTRVDIGQILLGTVTNPGGLVKRGNSLYTVSGNSGEAKYNAPTVGRAGTMQTSALEFSNVDLAAEFTDMIVTQRGYQANSRIITVSDTLLEELINLKR